MNKTENTSALFSKFAEAYQDKYMDLSRYHDTFDLFCENVKKKNAAILDIACGPGNITSYLLKKRPDFKILGIDLAPKMIELAKKNNPMAQFRIMDGRDIDKLENKYEAMIRARIHKTKMI